MRMFALTVLSALLLCGCSSKPKVQEFDPVAPEVAGSSVPSGSIETVRQSPDVRVYHLGRMIDPNNPNIMHEASTIYVLSDSGAWNLSPNYPPRDPRHNRSITLEAPLTAEKIMEIRTLRATNSLMLDLGNKLVQTHNDLVAEKKKREKEAKTKTDSESVLQEQIRKLQEISKKQAQKIVELELKIKETNLQQGRTK